MRTREELVALANEALKEGTTFMLDVTRVAEAVMQSGPLCLDAGLLAAMDLKVRRMREFMLAVYEERASNRVHQIELERQREQDYQLFLTQPNKAA